MRGVITATRGNHGQSIGFAARRHGLAATIVVPHGNCAEKNAAMRALGAELIEHGDDFQAAREHAARLATRRGLHLVPSFDPRLVRGVATLLRSSSSRRCRALTWCSSRSAWARASAARWRHARTRPVDAVVGVVSAHATAYRAPSRRPPRRARDHRGSPTAWPAARPCPRRSR